jgi:O-antigen ligase
MNFDPINIPKLLSLSSFSLINFYVYWLFLSSNFLSKSQKVFFVISLSFILSLIPTMIFHSDSISTQFWGTWGRSTGFLAFFSLISLFFVASLVTSKDQVEILLKYFLRLSYFITAYTTLQFGQIDPISWSQQLPVATLGNINFMSAFLGFASVVCFYQLLRAESNWTQKIFFMTIISWNMTLCWMSGSIQGILVWFLGFLILLGGKSGVFRWSLIRYIPLLTICIPLLLLIISGGVGKGPLGKFLMQDTFLFRVDYWLAGLRMTIKNPLTGVGIDSYGDYYRMYRDTTATYRTGSQRVSNTAHNIFLDISSGSGILSLIIILFLFSSIIGMGVKVVRKTNDLQTVMLLALAVSYFAYSMISINQLGVSCWGWIFFGLLFGQVAHSNHGRRSIHISPERLSLSAKVTPQSTKVKSQLARNKYKDPSRKNVSPKHANRLALFVLFLVGASLALPPSVKDAQYLHAYKQRNPQEMYEISVSKMTPDLLREHALKFFVDNGNIELATDLARQSVVLNRRNFTALNVIRLLTSTSDEEKLAAISELEMIEPNDLQFREELESQRRELILGND